MGAGPAGEPAAESGLPEPDEADILEERGRDYKRDEKGRFAGGGGGGSGGRGASSHLQTSPHGTNTFKVQGFRSKQALNNHWQNGRTHSSDMRGTESVQNPIMKPERLRCANPL